MQSLLQDLIGNVTSVIDMAVCNCANCGVTFAIPEKMEKRLRNNHETFYCPSGHTNYFPSKSEAEKIKEQAEREKRNLEAQLKNAQESKEYWNRQYKSMRQDAIVLKGQKTKLVNRIKNGVCPCCNRTFKDLAEHMKKQHPEL